MTRNQLIALSLAALVLFLQSANASYQPQPQRDNSHVVVLKTSDLRSAYLQRAGIVHYDPSNMSPDGLRSQLQRHFDVVLGLLLVSTPRSIETALVRLEAADDHTWSDEERADWRNKLATNRYLQMQRLAAYRDAGRFPLNEGQAKHSVPIFVDQHDTACAVGHLMRLSGFTSDVAKIQKANNLVYVPDAVRSAITSWALTSGLTWEEAALIQPGYEWYGEYNASNYEPLELTLEKNGLRFENFQLTAANYRKVSIPIDPDDPDLPPPTCGPGPVGPCFVLTTGTVPSLNGLGLLTGKGFYSYQGFQFPKHTPDGTHWLAIAGKTELPQQPQLLHNLQATAAENRGQLVTIQFDVSAIAENQRINGISESSYLAQGGFRDPLTFNVPDAIYYLKTTARDGITNLASLSINESTPALGYSQKTDTKSFAAKQKISVTANLWLLDGVAIDTFLLDFNVVNVPEPATAIMAMIGLLAIVAPRRHRRSAT